MLWVLARLARSTVLFWRLEMAAMVVLGEGEGEERGEVSVLMNVAGMPI